METLDTPPLIDRLRQFATQLEHTSPERVDFIRGVLNKSQSQAFYNGMITGLGIAYNLVKFTEGSTDSKSASLGLLIAVLSRIVLDKADDPQDLELFAWVGEDEFGSGEVGLKQAQVPAGLIPLVAIRQDRMDQDYIREQLALQAKSFGKTIRLCRFVFAEELVALSGDDNGQEESSDQKA